MSAHDAGDKNWRKQLVHAFLILGELAEPGVCSVSSEVAAPISRGQLSATARRRVKFLKKDPDPNSLKLRDEALVQVAEGWLKGQFQRATC